MTKISTFPVITTDQFAKTVAFYEDHFGFVPFYEVEGYARLQHKDDPSAIIVIIQSNHDILPDACRHEAQGQILTVATQNLDEAYDCLYHEGLEIVKEPTQIGEGIRHFMVADPINSVFISIVTPPPGAACTA